MEIISKEKPSEEFMMEYITRCENESCRILLNIHEQDIIAEYVGYDRDFQIEEYDYYFKCPECGKLTSLIRLDEIESCILEMAKEKSRILKRSNYERK